MNQLWNKHDHKKSGFRFGIKIKINLQIWNQRTEIYQYQLFFWQIIIIQDLILQPVFIKEDMTISRYFKSSFRRLIINVLT